MKPDLNWIPELFYDVIGRVSPGAMVLLAGMAAWIGPVSAWHKIPEIFKEFSDKGLAGWACFGLLCALAYFAGVVLSALWELLESLQKKRGPHVPRGAEAKERNRRISAWLEGKDSEADPDTGLLCRCVSLHLSDQGVRLSKIAAEQSLCRVLITGFLVLLALALFSPWKWDAINPPSAAAYLFAAMALTVIACWKWLFTLRALHHDDLLALGYLLATQTALGRGGATALERGGGAG